MNEPIAIIGMGCRFPGGANTPDLLWQLLRDGIDAIGPMPSGRFDVDSFYDPTPGTPGKIVTREGGFLDQIDRFDAAFFGISAREATYMDPQQRLLLEVAWDALEDAGQVREKIAGSTTGVFVGMWTSDYEDAMYAASDNIDLYVTTGGGRYSASGRLSYIFDFRGPSMTVDSACSSSLVAVHLACQSLWSGEAQMAIAGGVNLIIEPQITIGYSRSGMLSPDARCKFGDANANGYVRSEGAGMIVLKPLSQALADGDPIHALIRGGAVNNDGHASPVLVAPSSVGQAAMLRDAYRMSGVTPGEVRYVDAHGTGTRVGDPVELIALSEVLSIGREANRYCAVGSVKTNIGHTEAASGIAGLIKSVLCLKNRAIPPSLHFHEPNPNIPWGEIPLVIQTEYAPWPDDVSPAFAAVNSFGVTGTNAHIILEEAPKLSVPTPNPSPLQWGGEKGRGCYLLPISAHSPQALAEQAQAFRQLLLESPGGLANIVYTASARRTHHAYRAAVAGLSAAELAERLGVLAQERRPLSPPDQLSQKRKVAFVFPGQGGQWIGMGRQLFEREPVFRAAIEACDTAMSRYADWSLIEELNSGARFDEIDVIQPALFGVQVALAALWRSWGIEPEAVIGHSMGEVAAAHVAGVLSLDNAAHIICRRSQLMKRVSNQGAMALVELTFDEAQAAIVGYESKLSIAVSNGPRSHVLSGDPEALQEVIQTLQSRDIFCRTIKVDVAAHSPHMDKLRPELVHDLGALRSESSPIQVYSTVTGAKREGDAFDAEYWGQNLRQPVLFSDALYQALQDGFNTFIEVNPHLTLLPAMERSLRDYDLDHLDSIALISSTRREEDEQVTMLSSLGTLYSRGYALDWDRLYPTGGRSIPLPAYPWQRERFWVDASPETPKSSRGARVPDHPLIGTRLPELAHLPGNFFWENPINSRFQNFVRDHYGALGEPAYADMALAATKSAFGDKLHRVTELTLEHAPPTSGSLQIIIVSNDADSAAVQIFGREDDTANWKRLASGKIAISQVESSWIHELAWEVAPREATKSATASGSWLIFADDSGLGENLATLLENQGGRAVMVKPHDMSLQSADDMRQFFATALKPDDPPCRGVVYLWGINNGDTSLQNALHLIQTMAQAEWRERPRLWLVTQQAQAVIDGESPALDQSPLWGFGRVVASEHPELWGGLIDLDANLPTETLLEEIVTPDGENQIAWRQGERYALRLVQKPLPFALPLARGGVGGGVITSDAAYLITGGLGGIGALVARWMVDQGARTLILMGRTLFPPREDWDSIDPASSLGQKIALVLDLEALGANICLASVDVADERGLLGFIDSYRTEGWPAVRGIMHTAGVLDDRLLLQLDDSSMTDVLRPKVDGSLLLHNHFSNLDFFVMFSSMSSIMGNQGQGNYAAANAYMDALAHYRRAQGLPAMSVNWAIWNDLGLAVTSGGQILAKQLAETGIDSLSNQQGMEALNSLFYADITQAVVIPADWSVYKQMRAGRTYPLLANLAAQTSAVEVTHVAENGLRESLLTMETSERWAVMQTALQEQVAQVLKLSPSQIIPDQPLGMFGLDSLMGMELRNRLEARFGITLPATLVWNYPTLVLMTPYLADKMGVPLTAEAAVEESLEPEFEAVGDLNDIIIDIQSLSDDDILKALMGKK